VAADLISEGLPLLQCGGVELHLDLVTFDTNEELACRTAVERSDFVLILFLREVALPGPFHCTR